MPQVGLGHRVELPLGTNISTQVAGWDLKLEQQIIEFGVHGRLKDLATGLFSSREFTLDLEPDSFALHFALLAIMQDPDNPGHTDMLLQWHPTNLVPAVDNPLFRAKLLIHTIPPFGAKHGEIPKGSVTYQFRPGTTVDFGTGPVELAA